MRPINKGSSPIDGDFVDYRDAFPYLLARIGNYCSFCERRIVTNLAVEHIQPKAITLYPHLEGKWDNYLLACVNCNSTKGDKDVTPETFYLPDRDNTLAAFTYLPDGTITPSRAGDAIAARSLLLTGLDKDVRQVTDENGQLVAADRKSQRMQAWLKGERAKKLYLKNPNAELLEAIIHWANSEGFYSVWITVFNDMPKICAALNSHFPGTASDCFNQNGDMISPRPDNGLPGAGKI